MNQAGDCREVGEVSYPCQEPPCGKCTLLGKRGRSLKELAWSWGWRAPPQKTEVAQVWLGTQMQSVIWFFQENSSFKEFCKPFFARSHGRAVGGGGSHLMC